jgi:hypothetical protein
MTRPAQKESERRTLDGVIAALGLRPDQEPEDGEAPDFTMRFAGRLIGIEITAYRSGDTVTQQITSASRRRTVRVEKPLAVEVIGGWTIVIARHSAAHPN